jgi:hypothetical protein
VTDHFLAGDAVPRYFGAYAEGAKLDCGEIGEAAQGAEDRLDADQWTCSRVSNPPVNAASYATCCIAASLA